MDLVLQSRQVMFNRRAYANRPFGELRALLAPDVQHGVYLTGVTRLERAIPALDGTVLEYGDVLTLTGAPRDVDRLATQIGDRVPPMSPADFIFLGLGLAIGVLIGMVSIPLGGIALTLGTGGGALLSGLVFGWFHAKRPTIGAFHPAAAQLVKDLGLATFIAATGLAAGPQAISLIKQYGIALPLAGLLVTLVPASISLLVGRKLLRMEPPVLLGAIAGQQCSTPAISAVQSAAGNSTPMIGYTVTYALSNIVLPLLGPVMVGIAGRLVG
jgi:AspT/YidE/YbjL antiporter-like protein